MENLQIFVDLEPMGISASDIESMLPNWKTKVMEVYKFKKDIGYELLLLTSVKSDSEAKEWLREYQELSKCSYSIRSTENCSGFRVKFKQRLHCIHNTGSNSTHGASKPKRTRNTNCSSSIAITLRTVNARYQGKDKTKAPDPDFPCEIKLNPVHNHSILTPDALRWRTVKDETKQQLLTLFESGHSPATALQSIKIDIQLKNDNFEDVLADRAVCPDYMYCYHLFKYFKGKADPLETTKEYLEKRIDQYNRENGNGTSAKVEFIEDNYVISLCPLLMKRAHMHIANTEEIVYLDSVCTVDNDEKRIFILTTASDCGGLPLGIIITSSESSNLLSTGFRLLQDILGIFIFRGNVDGPSFFMTGSLIEPIAIQSVWPKSKCLLSIFLILQSTWGWLTNSKNRISQNDRQELLQQFRNVIFANNSSECEELYRIALESSKKYPQYCKYLEKYWEHREMWTLSSRNYLRGGHNSNNISEAGMRLLKEKIFERIEAFNLLQITDFMLTRFLYYYEKQILDAAYNRCPKKIFDDIMKMPSNIAMELPDATDQLYLIPSEVTPQLFYLVSTDDLTCTCDDGRIGYTCNHVYSVCLYVKFEEFNMKTNNEAIRNFFYFIATGNKPPSEALKQCRDLSPSIENEFVESAETSGKSICSSNSDTEVDKQELIEEGLKLVKDISEILTKHLKRSPVEVVKTLDDFLQSFKKIKTVAELTDAGHTFLSDTTFSDSFN